MENVEKKLNRFQSKYFTDKLKQETEIMFSTMHNGKKFCGLMNLQKYKREFLIKAIKYNIKLAKSENEQELMVQVDYLCGTKKFKCGDLKKIKNLDSLVKLCVLECLKNYESLHNFNVDEMRIVNNIYKLILGSCGKEETTEIEQ